MKERPHIAWLDTAKFLGIFTIYLGHFGGAAGKAYLYVFTFHVPFFFLVSGCLASLSEETSVWGYFKKKFKSILAPFYVFVVLSIVVAVVVYDSTARDVAEMLWGGIVFGAVRNRFFAGSLWFLTCLFLVETSFEMMRRFLNRYIVLGVCILLRLFFIKYLWADSPRMPYNVDSAFRYSVYYAIGYCAFPHIERLFTLRTGRQKIVFLLSGFVAFCYSALVFEEHDLLAPLYGTPVIGFAFSIVGTLTSIWLVFVVSKLLESVTIFRDLGVHTLYLCGNEYIIKTIAPAAVGLLGFTISVPNPLTAYMYTLLLLFMVDKILRPVEERMIQAVCMSLGTSRLRSYGGRI